MDADKHFGFSIRHLNGRIYKIINGEYELPENYRLGKPCKRGHSLNGVSLRYKSTGNCVQCVATNSKRNKYKEQREELTKLQIDHLKADMEEAKMIRQWDNYYEELL